MDPNRLAPDPANGEKKQQAVQDAKDMYRHTVRTCEKLKIPVPPYDFQELIGKGGSGRVYKCRDRKTGDLVAIKIVDTDSVDYQMDAFDKDNTIKDFQKEVATLQALKDSQAQNINIIHEAYEVGSNLWIVSDYCTGGSVRTLMRALPPGKLGLEENYIVPIARELLVALVGLHSMGIIHRDIKCTNVYITETGALQLGDYGVVGVTDDQTNKRKTILGTPHWMPRELLSPSEGNEAFEGYGVEIDIWAYGCTVYEMATGMPPNARLPMQTLARALHKAPRLEGGQYSQQLRDFVAYCLNSDPQQRPTAQQALEHPYVANTQKKYPTGSLVKLIERYKLWEYGGGIRQSLFLQGGAPDVPEQVETSEPEDQDDDDWNFSTSDRFDTDFERRFSHMLGAGTQVMDFQMPSVLGNEPVSANSDAMSFPGDISNWDRLQAEFREQSVDRGGQSLARLYRLSASEYKLHTPMTESDRPKTSDDLPLRSSTQGTEAHESIVDLDEVGEWKPDAFNIDFVDSTTLKARKSRRMSTQDDDEEDDYQYGRQDDDDKRATMDWSFPNTSKKASPKRATMDWTFASARPADEEEPEARMDFPSFDESDAPSATRPALKHTQTMPLGEAGDYIHSTQSYRPATSPIRDSMASMIDLGDMDDADMTELTRPGTATSTTGSHFSDMTSGDPFDLEVESSQSDGDHNRFSYHKQWQSEGGGQLDRPTRRSIPMHTRGSSLSSTDNELDHPRRSNGLRYHLTEPTPPSTRAAEKLDIVGEDTVDLDNWPNFDQAGIERVPSHEQRSSVGGGALTLAFPPAVGPSAAALEEHASPSLLAAELENMCSVFAGSLMVTAEAFGQHSGLEGEESSGVTSGSESGVQQSASES